MKYITKWFNFTFLCVFAGLMFLVTQIESLFVSATVGIFGFIAGAIAFAQFYVLLDVIRSLRPMVKDSNNDNSSNGVDE